MKVAISIPTALFEEAEAVAKAERVPRSRIFAKALQEYLKRRRDRYVFEAYNRLSSEQHTTLPREWEAAFIESVRNTT